MPHPTVLPFATCDSYALHHSCNLTRLSRHNSVCESDAAFIASRFEFVPYPDPRERKHADRAYLMTKADISVKVVNGASYTTLHEAGCVGISFCAHSGAGRDIMTAMQGPTQKNDLM